MPVTIGVNDILKLFVLFSEKIRFVMSCEFTPVADDILIFFSENKATFHVNSLLADHLHNMSSLTFLGIKLNVVCC